MDISNNKPLVSALIVLAVVLVLAGAYALFHAATAKEEAAIKPSTSPAVKHMSEMGKMLGSQAGRSAMGSPGTK